jgi:hypothetical protein
MIPLSERVKIVQALDRAATLIGNSSVVEILNQLIAKFDFFLPLSNHGCYFPYKEIEEIPCKHSLTRTILPIKCTCQNHTRGPNNCATNKM